MLIQGYNLHSTDMSGTILGWGLLDQCASPESCWLFCTNNSTRTVILLQRGFKHISFLPSASKEKKAEPFEDTEANMGSWTLPLLCCKLYVSELESVVMCYSAIPCSYLHGLQFYNVWGCRPAAFSWHAATFGPLPHSISLKVLLLSFVGCICLCLNPFWT